MDSRVNLKQWMDEHDLSNAELARKLEVDTTYVWMIVSGKRPVSDGFIGKFAKCYGFDTAKDVFNGECQDQPA